MCKCAHKKNATACAAVSEQDKIQKIRLVSEELLHSCHLLGALNTAEGTAAVLARCVETFRSSLRSRPREGFTSAANYRERMDSSA